MRNFKSIAVWSMVLAVCFFSSILFAEAGEGMSSGLKRGGASISESGNVVKPPTQEGASQKKIDEGVSGPGAKQIRPKNSGLTVVTPQTPASTSTENANSTNNNNINNLEWGVFGLTQSDMGNPIFTSTGTIVKKPNFFGSGFEIVCPGKILIPMRLRPEFQVNGLVVRVCYEPVAYTGAGLGPIVVDIKGIRTRNINANP